MNKLIFIIAIVFSGMLTQAQETKTITDLEIAELIICKPTYDLTKILSEYDLDVTFTHDDRALIGNGSEVKKFAFELQKGSVIKEVFIRYNRNNAYHVKSFNAYQEPISNNNYSYVKSMGKTMGHFKLKAKCYQY